jgi:hypothetical protein
MISNYYNIILSYEIPYNVLDTTEQSSVDARERLFTNLKGIIPSSKYETFSVKLTIFQLKETMNYIVTFRAFFRSMEGLPMEEYCEARDLKDNARKELEDFFNSIDCDFKQLNIISLL